MCPVCACFVGRLFCVLVVCNSIDTITLPLFHLEQHCFVEAMRLTLVCLLLGALVLGNATAGRLEGPPLRAVRAAFTFDWCDCGRGKENLTLWPADDVHGKVEVIAGEGPRGLILETQSKR